MSLTEHFNEINRVTWRLNPYPTEPTSCENFQESQLMETGKTALSINLLVCTKYVPSVAKTGKYNNGKITCSNLQPRVRRPKHLKTTEDIIIIGHNQSTVSNTNPT